MYNTFQLFRLNIIVELCIYVNSNIISVIVRYSIYNERKNNIVQPHTYRFNAN